ncbi:hypothetical protein [Sporosarcina sp. G11-34]|uniref:hypothetical protein n=1 Tax=Sporosarcina sp. G11-34 TaxID=2849605 RepID=UPI0022A8EDA6|nr:hypothetical protein [Sporosarcina sp. G11-34]MCZ2259784.1 hypothetical protein [Sporosarcina sp. G11-34]
MILLICSCIVLLYSVVYIFKMNVNKDNFEKMIGMTVVMVFVTLSSVTIGIIVGIYFANDLTLSTIVSIIYGIVLGYFAGKSVNQLAIMEGLGAGVMGGMMGAMLGYMIPGNFNLMVIFMTVLFIIIISFFAHLITLESNKKNGKIIMVPRPYKWIISAILSTIIIITAVGLETYNLNNNIQDELQPTVGALC